MIQDSKFLPLVREIKQRHDLDFKSQQKEGKPIQYGFMDRSSPGKWWIINKSDSKDIMNVLHSLAKGDRTMLEAAKKDGSLVKVDWMPKGNSEK